MAICSCGLPVHYCQPAVAGDIIYADLKSELNTPLAMQALFSQSPVWEPLLQAFPFPSTLGEVTLHAFSGLRLYLQFTWEVGLHPSPLRFPPIAAFTSFPAPDHWACAAAPAGWSVCLHLTWEVGLPPSPVEFSSLCHSHKLSHSWLLGAHHHSRPLFSCQDWLVYLQSREGFPSHPLLSSGWPILFAICLYCSYC
jgi:hypothetical protein